MSTRKRWWRNPFDAAGLPCNLDDTESVVVASLPEGLAEECEAVLAGRYVEHLVQRRSAVPIWAWTNLLAHGTETELRRTSMVSGPAARAADNGWLRARRYLAGEVIDWAERTGSLTTLQARVLIPLELDLACSGNLSSWQPATWVACVLVALQQSARRP